MLEKAGEAILEEIRTNRSATWSGCARAVLMAVREPSDAVWLAGIGKIDAEEDLNSAFTAMIDAILSEDPSNG